MPSNAISADQLAEILRDVTVTPGPVATWLSRYWAVTYPSPQGRRLSYGCVEHLLLDEWDDLATELCETHEPGRAAESESELRALIALCRAMDDTDKEKTDAK